MNKYIPKGYKITILEPLNTLQLFITNKCNKRCKGCFYQGELGKDEMELSDYIRMINTGGKDLLPKRITILGGEPTMHPELPLMIAYNQSKKLKTTIYTNGYGINKLEGVDLTDVSVRIGVLGLHESEKPLDEIKPPSYPVGIVYMLRKDNVHELVDTFCYALKHFDVKYFYISSIRDIEVTGSFWKDTEDTLSNEEYAEEVHKFLTLYDGSVPIHVSRRGVIDHDFLNHPPTTCRFFNVFTNRKPCMCPFDISLGKIDEQFIEKRKCNKHKECLLQKIILVHVAKT